MKSFFSGYYAPSAGNLDLLWTEALVVLDTNILLDLYRVPEVTRAKIIDMLRSWRGRLWIPHQVGIEFHSRRMQTIAEVARKAESVPAEIHAKFEAYRKNVDEMELPNRGCPEVKELMENMANIEQKIAQMASRALAGALEPGGDDPVLATIDELLAGAVGPPPDNQEALKKIYAEGEQRYAVKMGPGYEDARKAQSDTPKFMAGGLLYEKQYGDLVLWKQVIAHARRNKILSVLFVTKDVKKDWWLIVPGKGRISPLPELCQEIFRDGGVESFWSYTLEDALAKYGQQKGVEVQQAIQDIRNSAPDGPSSTGDFDSYIRQASASVLNWDRNEDDVYLLSAAQALDIVLTAQEPHLIAGRSAVAPEHGGIVTTWESLIERQPELQFSVRSAAAKLHSAGMQHISFIILLPVDATEAHARDAKIIADTFWASRVQLAISHVIVGCVDNGRFRRLDSTT